MKRTVTFSLDDERERDKEILDWLDRQPNRSAVIRDAVWAVMHGQDRPAGPHDDVTLADIHQLVQEIKRDLERGAFGARAGQSEPVAEPDEAAAALDSLAALALS